MGILYGAGGRCPQKVGRYIKDRKFHYSPMDDSCNYAACQTDTSNLVPFYMRPASRADQCQQIDSVCGNFNTMAYGKSLQVFRNNNCGSKNTRTRDTRTSDRTDTSDIQAPPSNTDHGSIMIIVGVIVAGCAILGVGTYLAFSMVRHMRRR